MNRKPPPGLPTPKQILEFIEQSGSPAGKREIARAFNLSEHDLVMAIEVERPRNLALAGGGTGLLDEFEDLFRGGKAGGRFAHSTFLTVIATPA